MNNKFGTVRSTAGLPSVESARDAAIDDPRVRSMHGRVETIAGDGFSARIWREIRHRATVTPLDGGETQVLEAASANDLREKILHIQETMMAQSRQAQVDIAEPVEVWAAELTFAADGEVQRAEASSRDHLLKTILNWKAEATIASQPKPRERYQSMTKKEIDEGIATRNFRDLLGDAYYATEGNAEQIAAWLKDRKRPMDLPNLLEAYHWLNDRLCLEERP